MKTYGFPSRGQVSPKGRRTPTLSIASHGFDSLPSGKSFRTLKAYYTHRDKVEKFRFPSLGKVLSDVMCYNVCSNDQRVSIPFPRESPFRQDAQKAIDQIDQMCFDSLPPGKPFQTVKSELYKYLKESFDSLRSGKCLQKYGYEDIGVAEIKFRFPSRGKVSPKSCRMRRTKLRSNSFDSLRAGKCLQSWNVGARITEHEKFRFPSDGKVSPKLTENCWLSWF